MSDCVYEIEKERDKERERESVNAYFQDMREFAPLSTLTFLLSIFLNKKKNSLPRPWRVQTQACEPTEHRAMLSRQLVQGVAARRR